MKLVVVGDGACGKTSLIIAHAGGEFSDNYIPTAFDDYIIETYVEGKAVRNGVFIQKSNLALGWN